MSVEAAAQQSAASDGYDGEGPAVTAGAVPSIDSQSCVPVGFAVLDASSRVLYINDTLAAYACHRPQQLNDSPLAVVWPWLHCDLQEVAQRCRQYPDRPAQTDRMVDLDASAPVRRALFSCHAMQAPDGSVTIGLVVLDVTMRLQAEVALQESEERYRALVNGSPDAIMVLRDARILFANPAGVRMAGACDQAQILGRDSLQWITPRSRDAAMNVLATLKTQKVVSATLFEFMLPDGEIRWAESHAALVSFKGEAAVQIVSRDITARLRTEMALRASEERYRSLIDSSPDGIVVFEDEIIVYSNTVYARMIGRDRADELIGKSIFEIVPDEVLPLMREAVACVLRDRKPFVKETTASTSGEQRWFESATTVLEIAGHAVVQTTIRDITDHKHMVQATASLNELLEVRVADRTQQLAAALQELEAFSYSVSHDLRAPLRHISANASRLIEQPAVAADDDACRYARGIIDAAARLGRLVDDLLDFSRMGRTQMREVSVDMDGIVQLVRRDLETDAADRTIVWKVELLPLCQGDPAMLQLVWYNLIGNAIKYTGTRDEAHITVGAFSTATMATYYVRDNGVGFDMQYADKLFGVFERLHGQREFEGTGIGLATVRRIVQRLGGQVWAEASVDAGASFYFSLPVRTA